MPKGYWLATYKKIESKDNLGNYAAKATETIKSYGGNPLVRGGKYKRLEGDDFPRTVIWEFPTYEAAEKCYKDNPIILAYPNKRGMTGTQKNKKN